MNAETLASICGEWVGKEIVIDTDTRYVHTGNLEKICADCVVLTKADVHWTKDSGSGKEEYTHEMRNIGLRENRKLVVVPFSRIVSLSLLEDVITF